MVSTFAIPSSSSFFSLSNSYQKSSRLRLSLRNPGSNFDFRMLKFGGESRKTCLRCKATKGTDSGESENKSVLDAFFLGKALAEVINERIESTVGEVLGNIGRFQAEQQKQVEEIQEEILERAKRAREKAARETMEAQGRVAPPKPATITQKPATDVVSYVAPTSAHTSTVGSNGISNENLSGISGSSMGGIVESSSSSDEKSV